MKDQKKDIVRYTAFWLWLVAVTLGVWFVYVEVLQAIPDLLIGILGVNRELLGSLAANTIVWQLLQTILFVLLWWRAVKVVVLHGSPFHFGMEISEGRENGGQTGRMVWRVCIGDNNVYLNEYKGQFWYGAVFRAHPNSDKLVRSRLELIVLALPFGFTLQVQESHLFIKKKDDHKARARMFRLVADKYSKTRDHTTPDRFRTEAVRHLRHVGQYFEEEKRVKRIDDLRWYSYIGGDGYVMDDFNNRVSYKYLEEENKYKVTELGSNGEGEKVVNSISELRSVVKADFQSTWGDDVESGVMLEEAPEFYLQHGPDRSQSDE